VFRAYNGSAFVDCARFYAKTGPNFGVGDQEGILYFDTGDGVLYYTGLKINPDGGVFMPRLKSGADQAAAGAAVGELWYNNYGSIYVGI